MFNGLYQFQKEDVAKLSDQSCGLIANEMGTGKTHEAISLMHDWRTQVFEDTGKVLPILIVAPLDTFPSWQEKIADQLKEYEVYTVDPKKRALFIDALLGDMADVYIIHWAALRLIIPEFIKNHIVFSVVVADEVHAIANQKAQVSKALKQIKTYTKLGLSGTASGDKPWGLWSVLNWLDAKTWSSYWRFVKFYVETDKQKKLQRDSDGNIVYDENGSPQYDYYQVFIGPKNIEGLHKRISRYYVRHLKQGNCCEHHPDGVMSYLPPKLYERLYVTLSPQQRRIYNEMEEQMVAWLESGEPLVAPVVIAQLTRLSQICLGTPEFTEDGKIHLTMPSPKIQLVKDMLLEYDTKPFVIFTSSKRMAYLAAEQFRDAGISTEVLSGDTPKDRRQRMVSDFVAGEFRVFIGVIQAVAEGIDGLQRRADTVIFLDRSWRAIKNQQAEDRLHRGGQVSAVTILDIVAYDTLEDERPDSKSKLAKLNDKWNMVQEILNG